MPRWTEENTGSILWEVTNGKVTDLCLMGQIDEIAESIAIIINAIADDANIDIKEIMGYVNSKLDRIKSNNDKNKGI